MWAGDPALFRYSREALQIEILASLFVLIGVVGWLWTCSYGWKEGIGWFSLMSLRQFGVPIWYILKLAGDRREFQYFKYPALMYFGGTVGYTVCRYLI